MAEPPVPADGNPSTEDPGENKPWDELFVNNPDEYFGNTNSQKESRPKIGDPKEVALHTFVTDNKYNENRTVRYNMQQLEAMLEHPFAELIIKTPSYEDAQHFYNERSYTAFTDAQHDAINDLENFTCTFIVQNCKSIINMMPDKYQLDSKNITKKIYKLFTLSPKRLDLLEIKSYYTKGKFEITDPWLPPNMGTDRINDICHPGLADLPQVKASDDLTNYRMESRTNPLGFEPDPPQDTPREEDTHSDDDEANAHVLLDDICQNAHFNERNDKDRGQLSPHIFLRETRAYPH